MEEFPAISGSKRRRWGTVYLRKCSLKKPRNGKEEFSSADGNGFIRQVRDPIPVFVGQSCFASLGSLFNGIMEKNDHAVMFLGLKGIDSGFRNSSSGFTMEDFCSDLKAVFNGVQHFALVGFLGHEINCELASFLSKSFLDTSHGVGLVSCHAHGGRGSCSCSSRAESWVENEGRLFAEIENIRWVFVHNSKRKYTDPIILKSPCTSYQLGLLFSNYQFRPPMLPVAAHANALERMLIIFVHGFTQRMRWKDTVRNAKAFIQFVSQFFMQKKSLSVFRDARFKTNCYSLPMIIQNDIFSAGVYLNLGRYRSGWLDGIADASFSVMVLSSKHLKLPRPCLCNSRFMSENVITGSCSGPKSNSEEMANTKLEVLTLHYGSNKQVIEGDVTPLNFILAAKLQHSANRVINHLARLYDIDAPLTSIFASVIISYPEFYFPPAVDHKFITNSFAQSLSRKYQEKSLNASLINACQIARLSSNHLNPMLAGKLKINCPKRGKSSLFGINHVPDRIKNYEANAMHVAEQCYVTAENKMKQNCKKVIEPLKYQALELCPNNFIETDQMLLTEEHVGPNDTEVFDNILSQPMEDGLFHNHEDDATQVMTGVCTRRKRCLDTGMKMSLRKRTIKKQSGLAVVEAIPLKKRNAANGKFKRKTTNKSLEAFLNVWMTEKMKENGLEKEHLLPFLSHSPKMVECYHCKRLVLPENKVSCSTGSCCRVYHLSCAKASHGHLSRKKNKQFKCPQHVCMVCKGSNHRLLRCVRCSIAVHRKCSPWPESIIFLDDKSNQIVCWRHQQNWKLENKHIEVIRDIKEAFQSLPIPYMNEEFNVDEDFWKDVMENNSEPPPYVHIRRNVFLVKRKRDDIDDGIGCSCGTDAVVCSENCECRTQSMSCSKACHCSEQCKNKPFRKEKKIKIVKTESCGWGAEAAENVKKGEFIVEYTGEVINDALCEERLWEMKHKGANNFYMCEIGKDFIIDATFKGNLSRFLNHSCDSNCKLEKWRVDGETRVGIFAAKDIVCGEPLTYDYRFIQFGPNVKCHCGAAICQGNIGEPFNMSGVKSGKNKVSSIDKDEVCQSSASSIIKNGTLQFTSRMHGENRVQNQKKNKTAREQIEHKCEGRPKKAYAGTGLKRERKGRGLLQVSSFEIADGPESNKFEKFNPPFMTKRLKRDKGVSSKEVDFLSPSKLNSSRSKSIETIKSMPLPTGKTTFYQADNFECYEMVRLTEGRDNMAVNIRSSHDTAQATVADRMDKFNEHISHCRNDDYLLSERIDNKYKSCKFSSKSEDRKVGASNKTIEKMLHGCINTGCSGSTMNTPDQCLHPVKRHGSTAGRCLFSLPPQESFILTSKKNKVIPKIEHDASSGVVQDPEDQILYQNSQNHRGHIRHLNRNKPNIGTVHTFVDCHGGSVSSQLLESTNGIGQGIKRHNFKNKISKDYESHLQWGCQRHR